MPGRQTKLQEFARKRHREEDSEAQPHNKRVKTWFAVFLQNSAVTTFQEDFWEDGIEDGGRKFSSPAFYSNVCAVSAFDGMHELKDSHFQIDRRALEFARRKTRRKKDRGVGCRKIKKKNNLQRIFELMLSAENVEDKHMQTQMLDFLQGNQVKSRDFIVAECIESFIAVTSHLKDPEILKKIYNVVKTFDENELKIVCEAFQMKGDEFRNIGLLMFFAILKYITTQTRLDDDYWKSQYLDENDKTLFPKRLQFIAEILGILNKKKHFQLQKTNRELQRVVIVLMSRFLPNPNLFVEDMQSRLGGLGWAEKHSRTPLDLQ